MVMAFPLMGDWNVWKFSNEKRVWIRKYLWLGASNKFLFFEYLSQSLVGKGVLSLNDAKASMPQLRGREGWKYVESLGLEGGKDE
jgi:hypothetical protein